MNPLLQKPASRRVKQVKLSGHPDAAVFVRALNGREISQLYEKLRATKATEDSLALQLEAYVSDANGMATLNAGEGAAVLETIDGVDVKRLIKAGDKLNILSDEAIEEELKN